VTGEDCEFITTEAGDEIAVAHCSKQALGDDNQEFVADAVSMNIIHSLETVQVHQ